MTITALPPTTRISLRLADPAAAGLDLPGRIGARTVAEGRTALCLGPDEWLLEAPEADRAALLATLDAIATPVSAVEVSDREITFALEGPGVLDLLATGCPLDLARLPVGGGTRTVFDTVQVVLTREAEDRFHLTVWRSFAPHVRALLDLAARELAAGL
jgi:sarcosine oxidase subunit gamma